MGKPRKPQLPKTLRSQERAQPQPDAAAPDRAERVRRLVGEAAGLLAAKRPGEAVAHLTEAVELDPNNVAAAINLGGAYILQGRHERATPVLERAAQLEPHNAQIWSNLAAAYLGKLPFSTAERQDKAIRAYEKALELDPRAANVHYNLGLIYLERNDKLRAAAHFYAALETDPQDRDARRFLDELDRAEAAEPAAPVDDPSAE